jgi:hypothetical protein
VFYFFYSEILVLCKNIITPKYPWSVFLGLKSENDPRWVVFENSSNSTKVRLSADACGLGDQGLGTGLVV